MTQREIERLMKFAEEADVDDERNTDSDSDDNSPLTMQIKDLKELRGKLKEAQARIERDPHQQTINLTDTDCRAQRGVGPGYNSQVAVDCKHQIIVGADVVSDANDTHRLLPMIQEMEDNTKSEGQPKQVFADSGYASSAACRKLETMPHIDAYVPTREQVHRQRSPAGPFDKSKFELDPISQTCRCPLDQPMRIHRRGINKSGEPYINFIGTECPSCSSRSQCTKAQYRNIVVHLAEPLVQRMRQKMNTYAGRAAMHLRKQTAEPVFGQLKEHLGFRRFHLRGILKVKGEFSLLCGAFNLKKLHGFLNSRALAGALVQIKAIPVSIAAFGRDLWAFFYCLKLKIGLLKLHAA